MSRPKITRAARLAGLLLLVPAAVVTFSLSTVSPASAASTAASTATTDGSAQLGTTPKQKDQGTFEWGQWF